MKRLKSGGPAQPRGHRLGGAAFGSPRLYKGEALCTLLGVIQNWWTVSGLILDIFGFGILAVDVAREYLRWKRTEEIRRGAFAAEALYRDIDVANLEDTTPLGAARREHRELNKTIRASRIVLAEWAAFGEERRDAAARPLDPRAIELHKIADSLATKPYKRAPIIAGILFVIVGFLLQVVGAIPCSVLS